MKEYLILVKHSLPEIVESLPARNGGCQTKLESRVVSGLHEHDRSTKPFLSARQFQDAIGGFFEKPDRLVFGKQTADAAQARFPML